MPIKGGHAKVYQAFGMVKTMMEWVKWGAAHGYDAPFDTLRKRIYAGKTMEQALGERRFITKASQDNSPNKDDLNLYNSKVTDFLEKSAGAKDVIVLFRRSSSCMEYRTYKNKPLDDIRYLKTQNDVVEISEMNGEVIYRKPGIVRF